MLNRITGGEVGYNDKLDNEAFRASFLIKCALSRLPDLLATIPEIVVGRYQLKLFHDGFFRKTRVERFEKEKDVILIKRHADAFSILLDDRPDLLLVVITKECDAPEVEGGRIDRDAKTEAQRLVSIPSFDHFPAIDIDDPAPRRVGNGETDRMVLRKVI